MSSLRSVMVLVGAMAACAPAAAQEVLDPTEPTTIGGPATPAGTPEPRWRLESTLVAADRRIATVNGEVVGVGDRVNNATVTEIQPHAVKLRVNGQTIELRLDSGVDPKSG